MNIDTKQIGLGLMAGVMIGGATLGTLSVSAQSGDSESGEKRGRRGHNMEIVSEVLGLSKEDIKQAREDGKDFEAIVTENGFSDVDEFRAAVDVKLTEKWQEDGLSEEEIAEKLEKKAEHHEIRESLSAVREELIGLTRSEVKERVEAGETFEEILASAGYDDKDAFHEALTTKASEVWAAADVDQETIDDRLEHMEKRFERRGEHGGRRGGPGHRDSTESSTVEES